MNEARIHAAKIHRRIAAEALTSSAYASHITTADRERIQSEQLKYAEEVELGMHDNNLTIAQRMHFFKTGESIPLLRV